MSSSIVSTMYPWVGALAENQKVQKWFIAIFPSRMPGAPVQAHLVWPPELVTNTLRVLGCDSGGPAPGGAGSGGRARQLHLRAEP